MDTVCKTPIIENVDFAIIGGSISAVSAALFLAEHNYKVILIVKETYLISDLCSPNYYYLENIKNEDNKYFNAIFNASIDAKDACYEGCRVLNPDRLKLNAEEVCDSYGIEYIYFALPIDVLSTDNEMKMLRIAGKFGICGICCKQVLNFGKCKIFDRYIINIMDSPDISKKEVIKAKIFSDSEFDIYARPGAYGKGHVTLDIPLFDNIGETKGPGLKYNLKLNALNILKWVKDNVPGFNKIKPGRSGGEGFSSFLNVEGEIEKGIKKAEDALSGLGTESDINKRVSMPYDMKMISNNSSLNYREYETFESEEPEINSIERADLVVVGGGTSGTMAAIYGAMQGARTVLLESNNQLGGTSTVGGVSTYWFGKRFKETTELDKKVHDVYKMLNVEQRSGIWSVYDDFNPDIKSMVLLKMCIDAGVKVLFNTLSFAGIVEKDNKNRLTGVAAANGAKVTAFLGKYVIDATGDGDVAAFAGAQYTYGNSRDMFTYWASLAQYISPEKYKNNFSSTVVVSDIKDYTCFIKAGRRRGESTYDHGAYVAPRESRHISGLYQITLKDIVSFRNYEDTVYTCFSNYDPKGKVTADMVYAGVLPPPASSAIPLRSLLPVDDSGNYIKGILIAGKAISCTHNAFPGIRMQPDMQHQGAVLGLIAADAISKDTDVLNLDIKSVQKEIWDLTSDDLKITEQRILNESEIVSQIDENQRLNWIDLPLTDEVKSMPITIRAAVAEGEKILPYLEYEFINEGNNSRKSSLARFILWHGSDTATDFMLNEILDELLLQDGLPVRKGSTMCAQLLPDHGVMPEIVYKLNLLAWSKNDYIYKPFDEVLKRLISIDRDYFDIRKGIYHYIESFAYVAERTCLKEFVPMLKTILNFPEIKNAVNSKEMRIDIIEERLSILGFSILRALARCGDIEGYYGLDRLLYNKCASVAISACMELQELTGNKAGMNPSEWNKIIKLIPKNISQHPVTEKIW